jgi:hypothetical protein
MMPSSMNAVWQKEPQKPSLPCVPEQTRRRLSASPVAEAGDVEGKFLAPCALRVWIDLGFDGGARCASRREEFSARLRIAR